MYWENQPELPSDKGSNWSRGATRDIGSPRFRSLHWPVLHKHTFIYIIVPNV